MKNLSSNKSCLLRITGADRKKLEALLFKRYPRSEWGTFFRFGYRVTAWGLHIAFVDMLAPRPGDLNRNSAIVEFDPAYILRAQLALEESDLGVGVIHSHPMGCSTAASSLDRDMDGYFGAEFSMYGNGRPYVTLRFARNRRGEFDFSGEAWLSGESFPVTDLCTVGASLRRELAEFPKMNIGDEQDHIHNQRVVELLGQEKVTRLTRATVGFIGCSGTGSPAAHVLCRARIGNFVLVDPKSFSGPNHERFHASTWHDLGRDEPKAHLLRRMILSINPAANVIVHKGNVLDEAILDDLLKCDLALGCTDTQHSRAALSDFSTHYLLPCIESGVLMRAKDGVLTEQVGELVRFSADEPCAWCLGRINEKTLQYEFMSDEEKEQRKRAAEEAVRLGIDGEQYWGGVPPQELTVGYLTTAVGAMQAGFAEGWITGAFQMPHQRLQFDIGMPLFGVVPVDKYRNPGCPCNRTKGRSDQARADRSVSRPAHWPKEESRKESEMIGYNDLPT